MAYRLNIVDSKNGLSFNVRYENLAKAKRPSITARNSDGKEIKQVTKYGDEILQKGSTRKAWVDDAGQEYSKTELNFWIDEQQVEEIDQTKVFDIEGFQPVCNYTDTYVISAYYEVYPDNNGMKKDIDRQKAEAANNTQMYKLWKYLDDNQLVARGEFNPASRGFIASDGYIRAIKVGGGWALEIGVFKEQKTFNHLQVGEPKAVKVKSKSKGSRIKLV